MMGATLGRAIAASSALHPLVIALNGELGAGKTTFVGGLLRALGVEGAVRSPTYTLIEPYELSGELSERRLYHLDLYRLADAGELEMLAPRDFLEAGAVLLVEWAEKGERTLPAPDLSITFVYPRDFVSQPAAISERTIEVAFKTSAGELLAASLN
jgi:tRNA threonylcarbamoyladenosine biosynthesis protein TsaE